MSQDQADRAFRSRLLTIQKSFGSADFVDLGSGAVSVALGRHPPGAFLLERAVVPTENFAGGSLSAVAGTIGTEGDPDAIASAIDLFTGTESALRQGTAGIAAVGRGTQGAELFLTLTPTGDAGGLDVLTAGALDVDLVFAVGDRNHGL